MSAATVVLGAARLQLWDLRRRPDAWMVLVTTPIATVTVLVLLLHGGRPDLAHVAVVGPGLMAVFQFALFEASEVLVADRARGVLEPMLASPAPLATVVLGRTAVVAGASFLAVVESAVVVALLTDGSIRLHHPALAVTAALATAAAILGFTVALSCLFLMTRAVRVLQNSLPWPVFLLSGVLVPVSLLPEWMQPVSRLVFLTSAAELFRAVLAPGAVEGLAGHLGVLLGTAAVAGVTGALLYRVAVFRLRVSGEAGLA